MLPLGKVKPNSGIRQPERSKAEESETLYSSMNPLSGEDGCMTSLNTTIPCGFCTGPSNATDWVKVNPGITAPCTSSASTMSLVVEGVRGTRIDQFVKLLQLTR